MTRKHVAMKRGKRYEEFAEHVEHPRYGKAPRFTGLDPNPDSSAVHLHWNTRYFTKVQLREMKRLLGWRPIFPKDMPEAAPGYRAQTQAI